MFVFVWRIYIWHCWRWDGGFCVFVCGELEIKMLFSSKNQLKVKSLLFSPLQGQVRQQATNDCVQHLSNQLRRHRRHRNIPKSQQHQAALRRIRQLQQTVWFLFLLLTYSFNFWFVKTPNRNRSPLYYASFILRCFCYLAYAYWYKLHGKIKETVITTTSNKTLQLYQETVKQQSITNVYSFRRLWSCARRPLSKWTSVCLIKSLTVKSMISAQTSQPEKRVWGQWVQDHQHWDRLKNRNPKRVKKHNEKWYS